MFTLKLYRRTAPDTVITKVLSVHHVQTMTFEHGDNKALEIWAFDGPEPSTYLSFLVGDEARHRADFGANPEPNMTLRPEHDWFGWGLLENAAGKTTEHFRPAGYG